ncbi:MAG: TauD/TfdA family dioxygenase [Rhodospirillaceae bacterium]|nr:TauD/TfdA family dioxygenase [Rhodospirillaceae bacterium]
MTLKITPLTSIIAAEVSGIDLAEPQDDATVAALRQALLDHLVLIFRGQDLSEPEQVRFAGFFGTPFEIRQHDNLERRPDADSRVMLVSNIVENGKLIGALPGGELQFHSDSAFDEHPLMATVLYSETLPSRGGETKFANMYAVLDALDPDVRDRLEGRGGVNVFDFVTQVKTEKLDRANSVHFTHPAIRTHPETGRRALYVNRLMTEEITDMEPGESSALLSDLFDMVERDEFHYVHSWLPGDLLIWDNRGAQHARTDYPLDEPRLLRRVGIQGDKPF